MSAQASAPCFATQPLVRSFILRASWGQVVRKATEIENKASCRAIWNLTTREIQTAKDPEAPQGSECEVSSKTGLCFIRSLFSGQMSA